MNQMPTSDLIFSLKHLCKCRAQIHQVHAHAITTALFSLDPSPLLKNILHSFASSSLHSPNTTAYDLTYSTNVFNLIPNPSTFNCNDIIRAHTLLHSPRTAFTFFLQMRRRPIAPNSHTFPIVLKACELLQNAHSLAMALHAQLTKFGFSDNVYVCSTLCCTYGRSGDIRSAEAVFDEMPISLRDVFTYTAMIDGLFKAGEYDRARGLFDEMPHSFRDKVTYSAIIDGLFKAGEYDRARGLFDEMTHSFRDKVTYNAMIDGLFKAGEYDRARGLFDEMPHSFRDKVTYSAMIDGLFKAGEYDRARGLFDEMPHSFRDEVTYNAMIDGLCKSGEINCARELFDEMPKSFRGVVTYNAMIDGFCKAGHISCARDLFDEVPISIRNVVTYTTMINGFCKAGQINCARELFDKMPNSIRNVVSYNVMLMGLAMHGHSGSMLEQCFSRMLEDGVKPNGVTILAILVGCSHSGLINDAKRMFMEMESVYGVPREMHHYGCMVDLLARAGLINEAREFIEGMPMEGKPYVAVWGALLGGCKTYGDVEVAEEAAKQLMLLKPKDGAVFSSLAHIYANLGQWDEVAKVQRLRGRPGVKKRHGCSTIEICSKEIA